MVRLLQGKTNHPLRLCFHSPLSWDMYQPRLEWLRFLKSTVGSRMKVPCSITCICSNRSKLYPAGERTLSWLARSAIATPAFQAPEESLSWSILIYSHLKPLRGRVEQTRGIGAGIQDRSGPWAARSAIATAALILITWSRCAGILHSSFYIEPLKEILRTIFYRDLHKWNLQNLTCYLFFALLGSLWSC